MKFIAILILALSLAIPCFGQEHHQEEEFEHHCEFEEGSLTLAIGAPYSFEIESVGVNFRMYYNIGEKICFGPEYSYFRNEEYEIVDFDFIVHYIFETHLVGIYPLFGGNYTVEVDRIDEETEEAFGVVYGAGIHRNFSNWTIFAEYSRIELGIDDQFVTVGIMHMF